MKKKNTYGAFDDYDYKSPANSNEEDDQSSISGARFVDDLGIDYTDISDDELETITEEEERYSTIYKDPLPNAPYVKECATKTKEEKRLVYCEICKILRDPNSTDAEKEDAKFKAICYMYALIRKLIKKYCSSFVNESNYNDFTQNGIRALLEHLDEYEPENCVPSTYFYDHIKHELIKSVSGERGLTRYYNEKLTIINRAINKFQQANKPYTEVEIAAETGEPLLTVRRVLNAINSQAVTPLDKIEYMVTEREESPEEKCIKEQQQELVRKAMYHILALDKNGNPLNDNTYLVVLYKYGFVTGEPLSQSEIAKRLKIPVDAVRSSLALASKKLKNEKVPASVLLGRETTPEEEAMYAKKLGALFPEYNFDEQIRQKDNISKQTSYNSKKANQRALDELASLNDDDF